VLPSESANSSSLPSSSRFARLGIDTARRATRRLFFAFAPRFAPDSCAFERIRGRRACRCHCRSSTRTSGTHVQRQLDDGPSPHYNGALAKWQSGAVGCERHSSSFPDVLHSAKSAVAASYVPTTFSSTHVWSFHCEWLFPECCFACLTAASPPHQVAIPGRLADPSLTTAFECLPQRPHWSCPPLLEHVRF